MRHNELLQTLQNLTNEKPKQKEIAEALGVDIGRIGKRASRNSEYSLDELQKINYYYGQKYYEFDLFSGIYGQRISQNVIKKSLNNAQCGKNVVNIIFRPDVKFSAGYGTEVFEENNIEYVSLDECIFRTERGTKINPKNCELLTVSGNSMYPKWEDGDRFILDKSVTTFIDGQIFAFKHNGECYIKEICLLGKRAKAIPINKEYEPFFIEPEDDLVIFGRVVPRVRL